MESPQKQLLVFILLFWGNGFWTTGKNWNSRKQRKTQWKVFSFRELWLRKKEKARRTVLKHSESKRMEPNLKVLVLLFWKTEFQKKEKCNGKSSEAAFSLYSFVLGKWVLDHGKKLEFQETKKNAMESLQFQRIVA